MTASIPKLEFGPSYSRMQADVNVSRVSVRRAASKFSRLNDAAIATSAWRNPSFSCSSTCSFARMSISGSSMSVSMRSVGPFHYPKGFCAIAKTSRVWNSEQRRGGSNDAR